MIMLTRRKRRLSGIPTSLDDACNESPICKIGSALKRPATCSLHRNEIPSSTPLRPRNQPEVISLDTPHDPVAVITINESSTCDDDDDVIPATPPPETHGVISSATQRPVCPSISSEMFEGTLSCTELMESEDNDVVRGTPESVTSIPSDIPTLDENPTLDDLIYDLQKHQTPSKSQKTKTPDKTPTRLGASDEFTIMESDSIFNFVESTKKSTGLHNDLSSKQPATAIPAVGSQVANTHLSGASLTESQQYLDSQTGDSQATDSQGSNSLISRLQKRYSRGIELASQNITQHVTQNTQDVQAARMQEVQKLADKIVNEEALADLVPSMNTGFYGLPETVRQAMERLRGIKKLYEWQDTCLRLECLRSRSNLIYSSPTSGGKTLVAEILMLREVLLWKRDCILILPFVSLVQEKIRSMSELAVELDFVIEEYAGSRGSYPPKKRVTRKAIYIATIEKASGLINSLIDSNRLDSIGMCVVDELHMVGEPGGRGATLEITLTKLKLANKRAQIIGMSATLSNMKDLCSFLNAELYVNNFRPVNLDEYVKMGDDIYKVDPAPVDLDEKLKHERTLVFDYTPAMKVRDPDYLTGLLLEVIPQYSCLIFCPTKKNCESVAQLVCSLMPRRYKEEKKSERELLLHEMQDNCGKMCPILSKTLLYGVAYHHSGLTMDERKLIEEAYIAGTLCSIICTSTLAAGVNLPAKRVIVRAPYVGMGDLACSQYKQMIGRAGRAGIDSSGESILIIQKKDEQKMSKLIAGTMTECKSDLNAEDGRGMRKFILNLIGIKMCSCIEDIYSCISASLFAHQTNEVTVRAACDGALSALSKLELIIQKANSDGISRLEVTQLGLATYKGSVDVDISTRLHTDLCEAQLALSVQNYLHLIYLITPYELVNQVKPDWSIMFNLHGRLSEEDTHVADTVGVTERFLHFKTMNSKKCDQKSDFIHTRFFVALMLYDLYREMPVWDVANKYKQNRGFVQTMLQSAISFASCVYYFSMELEQFWAYHALYEQFIKKFSLCAKPELNALMELPAVKIGRARLLYKAGFGTLQEIAYCELSDLVSKVDYMTRANARQLKASAMMIIQEKSEALRAEADAVIALPTPVPDITP